MNSTRVIDLTSDEGRVPLRVTLITRFPPSSSGAAQPSADLAYTLADRYGVEVEVIRLVYPGDASATGPPVIMEVNPNWCRSASVAAHRANRSDVVILQLEPAHPVSFAEELISALEVPVVLYIDEVTPSDTEMVRAVRSLPGEVAAVVVPSKTAREWLVERAGPCRVEVVPHGAAWGALEAPTGRRSRILTWGFLHPDMGVERVIQALPLLDDVVPEAHYRVVGVAHPSWPGEDIAAYRERLERLADELGIGERVEFGPVLHAREDLLAEIRACDVVAVVYDTVDRTASRIIAEAVAAGRPVVATRFPGAAEILDSGAGITVAHDDPAELAAAFRSLLTDDRVYHDALDAARTLSPQMEWGTVTGRVLTLILELVAENEAVGSDRVL